MKNVEQIARYAWLAGIIDGEGSLVLSKQKNFNSLVCSLNIQMTDKETIEKVQKIYFEMGVTAAPIVMIDRRNEKWKNIWQVRVRRTLDLLKVAHACSKYSVTKRAQWNAMLMFLEARASRCTEVGDGRISSAKKHPNGPIEKAAFLALRAANLKGRSSIQPTMLR